MQQLTTFIRSAQRVPTGDGFHRYVVPEEELVAQAQVIEQIFDQIIPDWKDRVRGQEKDFDWWQKYRDVAQRALTQLQRQQELIENLGEAAPSLSAVQMHEWVWDGARSLWNSRHFREAVSAAAVKVNAETQNKVNRYDLSEVKLFQEVFSLKSPEPKKPRLRIIPDDGGDTYKSVHEGVTAFAVGCYKAIRNPAAHIPLDELAEHEALEQLASFSVLARWVDGASVEELGQRPN